MAVAAVVATAVLIVVEWVEEAPTRLEVVALPTQVTTAIPPALTFTAPTAAPSRAAPRDLAPYPIYGPAAELRSDVWLNAETPPRLANLRGRVVLLMFWGIDCAICREVLPYVRQWDALYGEQGLTVIGIHTPQTDAERKLPNLTAELRRLDVQYPVAQDSDSTMWSAYGVGVHPTLYLIDKGGNLRYQHVGIGGYTEVEQAIQALLGETHALEDTPTP